MVDEAFEISWDADDVAAKLAGATFEGLELAAEHLLEVSSERVPLEEGDLDRSGEVSSDRASGTVAVSSRESCRCVSRPRPVVCAGPSPAAS